MTTKHNLIFTNEVNGLRPKTNLEKRTTDNKIWTIYLDVFLWHEGGISPHDTKMWRTWHNTQHCPLFVWNQRTNKALSALSNNYKAIIISLIIFL